MSIRRCISFANKAEGDFPRVCRAANGSGYARLNRSGREVRGTREGHRERGSLRGSWARKPWKPISNRVTLITRPLPTIQRIALIALGTSVRALRERNVATVKTAVVSGREHSRIRQQMAERIRLRVVRLDDLPNRFFERPDRLPSARLVGRVDDRLQRLPVLGRRASSATAAYLGGSPLINE